MAGLYDDNTKGNWPAARGHFDELARLIDNYASGKDPYGNNYNYNHKYLGTVDYNQVKYVFHFTKIRADIRNEDPSRTGLRRHEHTWIECVKEAPAGTEIL
jgi:hypothetical protein